MTWYPRSITAGPQALRYWPANRTTHPPHSNESKWWSFSFLPETSPDVLSSYMPNFMPTLARLRCRPMLVGVMGPVVGMVGLVGSVALALSGTLWKDAALLFKGI